VQHTSSKYIVPTRVATPSVSKDHTSRPTVPKTTGAAPKDTVTSLTSNDGYFFSFYFFLILINTV